eukprot:CAMPEP_0170528740 /NCGR_PEP_ID=MMETSP0209-20121228/14222_1 /TAXON_ID=665100 ORGANISM="Litonotus pictus, Strain P1" /NCGR_SAMPLE_ID=MMETSP0209 /ASSEMBLY_ACC=CAM_ASM_000301 /LENGTH=250 /DNA_ID=CAMNT_0010820133 /DNA_START=509 /DNA_END=1262 /DNA_ORIENTATION=-
MLWVQESVINSRRSLVTIIAVINYVPGLIFYSWLLIYSENWKLTLWINSAIGAAFILVVEFLALESGKTFLRKKNYKGYLLNLLDVSTVNKRRRIFLGFLVKNGELFFIENYESNSNSSTSTEVKKKISEDDYSYMLKVKDGSIKEDIDPDEMPYQTETNNNSTNTNIISEGVDIEERREQPLMNTNIHDNNHIDFILIRQFFHYKSKDKSNESTKINNEDYGETIVCNKSIQTQNTATTQKHVYTPWTY